MNIKTALLFPQHRFDASPKLWQQPKYHQYKRAKQSNKYSGIRKKFKHSSKSNKPCNQTQAGDNQVPCIGRVGKTLCHGCALLNALAHVP